MAYINEQVRRKFKAESPTRFLDLEEFLDFIAEHMDPDDIFDEDKLEKWAEANGFERPKE